MSIAPKHRWSFVAAIPVALCDLSAWAGADVCGEPAKRTELSIAVVNHDSASLEPPPGDTRQQHRDLDVLARVESRRLSYGFGHRYVMFNFDGITPQTNAHLHTSFFPLHWIDEGDQGSFRVSLAPALSASSNVIGHPREYRGETLQLLAALAWRNEFSEAVTLRYGVCGDHRFGEYRIYPSVGVEWQPHPDWSLDLGFPASRISYRLTARWFSTLSVAPEGNEWHVMDRGRTEQSQFVYEAYALDWEVGWRALSGFAISAGIGTHLDSRYELTLATGEQVQLSTDAVLRIGAGLRWNF